MKKIRIGDCFHFGKQLLVVDHFDAGIPYYIWDGNKEMVQVADIPLPTLHLPISDDEKKWGIPPFSMILRGEKKEEYREIAGEKETFRNCPILWGVSAKCAMDVFDSSQLGEFLFSDWMNQQNKRDHKVLHLTNGYGHDKPQLWVHIESITIGRGKPEWGAPTDRDVFILKLGEVFHTKNLKV
jgi:hypothetical protein